MSVGKGVGLREISFFGDDRSYICGQLRTGLSRGRLRSSKVNTGTGHGIGLDVHEWPYLVKGDRTVLRPGMTFSNEPTICIYGEFGVRLEDHMVITETGARWFTQPAHSVDDPFGLER